MNTLRLKNINLQAPYRVLQDPEKHNNFYFVSDSGIRFDIDFTVNDSIIPSGAYEFGITNRLHGRSPQDPKLRLTILAIISRKDNPNLPRAIEEFDETISFLFDPPETPA